MYKTVSRPKYLWVKFVQFIDKKFDLLVFLFADKIIMEFSIE